MAIKPQITWKTIDNSSRIIKIGWGKFNDKLFVHFKKGQKYVYENVTEDTFNQIVNSESPGKAFQELIINKQIQGYKYE